MNKKYLYLVIALIFIIVIGTIFVIVNSSNSNISNQSNNQIQTNEKDSGETKNKDQGSEETNNNELKAKLKNKTRIFLEKYGTYTSYDKLENYNELKSFVTDNFFNQLLKQGENIKKDLKNIRTATSAVNIKEFDINKQIICKTEIRQEVERKDGKDILYKNAEVSFKKYNNDWRVDEINIK